MKLYGKVVVLLYIKGALCIHKDILVQECLLCLHWPIIQKQAQISNLFSRKSSGWFPLSGILFKWTSTEQHFVTGWQVVVNILHRTCVN
jgi:hypothetical protein